MRKKYFLTQIKKISNNFNILYCSKVLVYYTHEYLWYPDWERERSEWGDPRELTEGKCFTSLLLILQLTENVFLLTCFLLRNKHRKTRKIFMVIEYLLGDFGRWESVLEVQKLYATTYVPVPSPLEEDRVSLSEKESGKNDADPYFRVYWFLSF
jgi:hypothetical protein